MRIKHKYTHTDNDEGSWAISYGDMVTLLLSFFVLFFSIDFKKNNEKVLDESLQGIFSTQKIQAAKSEGSSEGNSKGSSVGSSVGSSAGSSKGGFKDEPIIKGMGIVRVQDGTFLMFFKGVSFFNTAKIDLTKEGQKALDEFYTKFIPLAGKYKIQVQAYTDPRGIKNVANRAFRDNLELSVLRSLSVVRHFNRLGMPSRRVEISGKGEMSERINKLLELNKLSKKEQEALARTISLVITRDEDLK